MTLHDALQILQDAVRILHQPLELTWQFPPSTPADPIHAVPAPDWPVRAPGVKGPWQKNAENWFYTQAAFPETCEGLALAGTPGLFHVTGWVPFTLYFDGEEKYKEDHAWKATGPIADPFPVAIEPGRVHRIALCTRPTELPNDEIMIGIEIRAQEVLDRGTDTAAIRAQLLVAQALAGTGPEASLVDEAVNDLDWAALERRDWPAFLASAERMEARLMPFSGRAKAMTIHLMGHSHIDMDWMWTWKDTEYCIRRDFKAATEILTDYPEVTFTHSQVSTYDTVLRTDPGILARVRDLMAEGRWENAAGTWVEGDLHMADGESIARHMLYAKDWTREHLGTEARVLWEPDTFGHPGNMPQIARLGELDCYFHWRCNPGREDNWPVREWEGLDGTRIVCFSSEYGNSLRPDAVVPKALAYHRFGFHNAHHIWGMGDHGGGISRHQIRCLSLYRDRPLIPTIRFSTMGQLLAAIQSEKKPLPRNRAETYSLFEGCWTTHAGIKRYNRHSEGALLAAETLSALAGLDRRDTLRGAWLPVLFNHFHDIMDGAAVHDTYKDAYERAEASLQAAQGVIRESADALLKPAAGGTSVTAINPLGFEQSGPVRLPLPAETRALASETGERLPVQPLDGEAVAVIPALPAAAARTWEQVRDGAPEFPSVAVREENEFFVIDTAHYTARLSKESGVIGSWDDKDLHRRLVAYGSPKHLTHVNTTRKDLALNVFTVIDEAPNGMSAWLINDHLKEAHLLRGAEVRLLETGPVFARFRVIHAFRNSRIEEDVIFYQQHPRVDFKAVIDWRERGNAEAGVPQLKVGFTAALSAARARYDGPFCVTERPADGQEQPGQKWTDLTGDEFGFTLYNDSKYGFDALGGRLRMTLLRNPYGPDLETDNGVHTIRFAFEPHAADRSLGEIARRGMAWNRPPVAAITARKPQTEAPLLRMRGGDPVLVTSIRRAEHSDALLVRLFETTGAPARIQLQHRDGLRAARQVNFLERPIGRALAVAEDGVPVEFRPWEIKTLLLTAGKR